MNFFEWQAYNQMLIMYSQIWIDYNVLMSNAITLKQKLEECEQVGLKRGQEIDKLKNLLSEKKDENQGLRVEAACLCMEIEKLNRQLEKERRRETNYAYFWYSHKQAIVSGYNSVIIAGKRVKYTCMSNTMDHGCKWDDMVCLGIGEKDTIRLETIGEQFKALGWKVIDTRPYYNMYSLVVSS